MAQATPETGHPGRRTLSPVVAVGLLMVAAQTTFRTWAQYGSWFFTDDYRLLLQAKESQLSVGYLLDPFDSQFMPLGRFFAWLVVESGTLNWQVAGLIALTVQLAASLACLWMLLVLFGTRWGVLVPLVVYLTSALPLPGFMWWAAAVNQVPMQLAFFLAVGSWVRYLRSSRKSGLLLTLVVVVVGLAAYVKVLLVVLVLVWIALAYFAEGSVAERVRTLWRGHRSSVLLGGAVAATYVVHYLVNVPQPFEETEGTPLLEVAETMLGTSLPTTLLGGPWRWWNTNPPIVLVDPPDIAVHLSWVALFALVAYAVLRRHNTGRAWVMFAGYVALLYVLLATSRGQLFGSFAGLELRYLTDAAPMWALTLGLAFMSLQGAPGSSRSRRSPLLTVAAPTSMVVLGTIVIAVGGVYSGVRYVHFWHNDNPSRDFASRLQESTAELPLADVADRLLPEPVMPKYTQPYNRLSRFVALTDQELRFPDSSHRIHLLDDDGGLRLAEVSPRAGSGTGPVPDCGWLIQESPAKVRLGSVAFPWGWWIRIPYLASNDGTVTVTLGTEETEATLRTGLNDLFVRVKGPTDTVAFSDLEPGTSLCVDNLEAGPLISDDSTTGGSG